MTNARSWTVQVFFSGTWATHWMARASRSIGDAAEQMAELSRRTPLCQFRVVDSNGNAVTP
jgi:hypothetical protein